MIPMMRPVVEDGTLKTSQRSLSGNPVSSKCHSSLLKILQIAPIAVEISPFLEYAGTERVIWNLDEGLVKRGICSQVAAPSNSNITGQLLPTLDVNVWSYTKDQSEMCEKYLEHCSKVVSYIKQENPDVVHDHDAGFIMHSGVDITKIDIPFLSTLHYSDFEAHMLEKWETVDNKIKEKAKFVAISNSQKNHIERIFKVPVYRVIYHGLDLSKFPFSEKRKNYLLSVGRISSFKGQDLAIKVAKETGNSLIIAGPIQTFNPESVDFYNTKIKNNLDRDFSDRRDKELSLKEIVELAEKEKGKIFYVGSVNDQERNFLNQYAKAFLMPQRWEEGFGLVMIEAMVCGNPVIAFNKGSIPEIVRNKENGYIVDNEEEMAECVGRINEIDPLNCRRDIKNRFSLEKQVDNYLEVYSSLSR